MPCGAICRFKIISHRLDDGAPHGTVLCEFENYSQFMHSSYTGYPQLQVIIICSMRKIQK